jgi:hypothetical protein
LRTFRDGYDEAPIALPIVAKLARICFVDTMILVNYVQFNQIVNTCKEIEATIALPGATSKPLYLLLIRQLAACPEISTGHLRACGKGYRFIGLGSV